jgi:hypothetical protein
MSRWPFHLDSGTLDDITDELGTSRDVCRQRAPVSAVLQRSPKRKEPAMSAPLPPHRPHPSTPVRPPSAERPGDTPAIGILTGLVGLGGLILLGLALTGLIWTPWQRFPAQTSAAGVVAEHGFNLIMGVVVAMPVAVGILVCGHVGLLLVRRRARARPESKGPRTVFVTLLLVSGLVVGYVALALQIVFALTVKLTD